jgi:CBS domain-containing protein
MTVEEVMQRDVATVAPDADVEAVLRLLREHELPGVPVVNEGGRCVGIVTESDLVLTDSDRDLHLPHHVDLLGAVVWLEPFSHFEERLRKALATNVSEVMTPDPVTVAPSDTVQDAARVISETGHNRLPVVEHGRLVGLVTRLDVLHALTRA